MGKVIKIAEFGAFVEFLPNVQGLLHISQLDTKRIEKVEEILKEGDKVKVKLLKLKTANSVFQERLL